MKRLFKMPVPYWQKREESERAHREADKEFTTLNRQIAPISDDAAMRAYNELAAAAERKAPAKARPTKAVRNEAPSEENRAAATYLRGVAAGLDEAQRKQFLRFVPGLM